MPEFPVPGFDDGPFAARAVECQPKPGSAYDMAKYNDWNVAAMWAVRCG